jgi:hypothetical protein
VDTLGGVEVSGHYTNNEALKDADATYDITVKVTNQRLVAPNVTEFHPIPNIEESRFNEIYGDCFISGFLEGGVFHATVACKNIVDSKSTDMGGEISVKAKVAGLDIKGKVEAGLTSGSEKKEYRSTIT